MTTLPKVDRGGADGWPWTCRQAADGAAQEGSAVLGLFHAGTGLARPVPEGGRLYGGQGDRQGGKHRCRPPRPLGGRDQGDGWRPHPTAARSWGLLRGDLPVGPRPAAGVGERLTGGARPRGRPEL